jgi:hypothetical protein
METGERIAADAVAQKLYDAQVPDRLATVGFKPHARSVSRVDAPLDQRALKELIGVWLCHEWASMLLCRSFGTGEYSMYGAFSVDIGTCTITDDPHADPIVENISITQ